jgi:hypothetical protein
VLPSLLLTAALTASSALAAPAPADSQITFDASLPRATFGDAVHQASTVLDGVHHKVDRWISEGVRKFDEIVADGLSCAWRMTTCDGI